MTFSKIRTNAVGKIRTFFDMGIKLKDFASTIEIRHTFLNLTISIYFININHIFKLLMGSIDENWYRYTVKAVY